MAQYSTEKNAFLSNNNTLYEVNLSGGAVSGYIPKGNLNTQADAFGRLRVSDLYTLLDSSFRFGDNERRWNTKTTGTASVVHDMSGGFMNLTVGSSSGDQIIRQTDRTFGYQPGKSLLIENSFTLSPGKQNLRQRIGYFTKDNGFFIELDGITPYLVKRSSVTGSVVDIKIEQSDWNVDPLDGTGPSGVVVDWTKSQLMWMDIEWLGVGSARMGFVFNGQFVICHIWHHANEIEGTYMTTASLSLRVELTNTGTTGSSSSLKHICSTIISEGGYERSGLTRSTSNPITGKNLTNGINNPLISIRLRPGRTEAVVIPREVTLYGLQATAFNYKVIRNVTSLTGASWFTTDSASSVQYDLSATSMSGGRVIFEGLFKGQETVPSIDLLDQFSNEIQLTRGIITGDSAGDILTIAVVPTTNNDDAIAALTWQERTS